MLALAKDFIIQHKLDANLRKKTYRAADLSAASVSAAVKDLRHAMQSDFENIVVGTPAATNAARAKIARHIVMHRLATMRKYVQGQQQQQQKQLQIQQQQRLLQQQRLQARITKTAAAPSTKQPVVKPDSPQKPRSKLGLWQPFSKAAANIPDGEATANTTTRGAGTTFFPTRPKPRPISLESTPEPSPDPQPQYFPTYRPQFPLQQTLQEARDGQTFQEDVRDPAAQQHPPVQADPVKPPPPAKIVRPSSLPPIIAELAGAPVDRPTTIIRANSVPSPIIAELAGDSPPCLPPPHMSEPPHMPEPPMPGPTHNMPDAPHMPESSNVPEPPYMSDPPYLSGSLYMLEPLQMLAEPPHMSEPPESPQAVILAPPPPPPPPRRAPSVLAISERNSPARRSTSSPVVLLALENAPAPAESSYTPSFLSPGSQAIATRPFAAKVHIKDEEGKLLTTALVLHEHIARGDSFDLALLERRLRSFMRFSGLGGARFLVRDHDGIDMIDSSCLAWAFTEAVHSDCLSVVWTAKVVIP